MLLTTSSAAASWLKIARNLCDWLPPELTFPKLSLSGETTMSLAEVGRTSRAPAKVVSSWRSAPVPQRCSALRWLGSLPAREESIAMAVRRCYGGGARAGVPIGSDNDRRVELPDA